MKLPVFALSALLAVSSASIEEIRAQRRLNKDFLQAMHSNRNVAAAETKGRAEKLRFLHENLIKASRQLQNNNQGYGSYQQGQAYADVGTWNGENWEFDGEVPFDLTSRSFKYSGCASIKTYDVERAQENGNGMVTDIFAVFRLCPADKCNKYSTAGCAKNYGEYAIEMKTYLSYVLGFYEERYTNYCEYCTPCDYKYEAEAKTALQTCSAEMEQQKNAQAQQNQQQAWSDYYNANNGDMSGWNVYGQNVDGNGNGNRKLDDAAAAADDAVADVDADADANANQNAANAVYGYWGGDGIWYEYDAAEALICRDGLSCEFCEWVTEQQYLGCDSYECGDYYTYCSDIYGQPKQFDVSQFLECAPFEAQNGNQYYLGPHCGSDHYTISLGVFTDENCLEYVGEDILLSKVLGYQYSDEDLFQLPKECISCDSAEGYEESLAQQTNGIYGDYVTAPEKDQDGVVAVCRALYEGSAQCNMHMNSYSTISKYMSQYEIEVEQRTCSFIDNIINGAYDETGEIYLSSGSFDFHDWRNPKQLKRLRMPAGQAVLLSASIILFVFSLAMVIYTQRSFRRGKTTDPWKTEGLSPVQLSRTTSGIMMARSRSGPGTAPLI